MSDKEPAKKKLQVVFCQSPGHDRQNPVSKSGAVTRKNQISNNSSRFAVQGATEQRQQDLERTSLEGHAAPVPQNQSQIDTLQPAQLTFNLLALPSGFKLVFLFFGGWGVEGGI